MHLCIGENATLKGLDVLQRALKECLCISKQFPEFLYQFCFVEVARVFAQCAGVTTCPKKKKNNGDTSMSAVHALNAYARPARARLLFVTATVTSKNKLASAVVPCPWHGLTRYGHEL